jgi:hypothetical protein
MIVRKSKAAAKLFALSVLVLFIFLGGQALFY